MLGLLVRVELRGHHGATVLVAEPARSGTTTGDHAHVLHTLAGRDTTRKVMMRLMLMRSLHRLVLLLLLLLPLLVLEGMCDVGHRRCHHLVKPKTLLALGVPNEAVAADHGLLRWEFLQSVWTWTGCGCRKIRMRDVSTQWRMLLLLLLLLGSLHPVGH